MNDIASQIERLKAIRPRLHAAAGDLSKELGGAPVVVVVGGSAKHGVDATLAGWANLVEGREGRFRDVLGILQAAVQLESFLHYVEDELFQDIKGKMPARTWWSSRQAAMAAAPRKTGAADRPDGRSA
jgi:hypothetical protein